ncbi:hypothetical protein E2320_007494, partial [Naja naja]
DFLKDFCRRLTWNHELLGCIIKRKSVAGEIVLVTGAARGIGRLIAFEFAKQRSRLVLWDINKSGIEETAEDCRKLGVEAYPYVVDCSLKEEIYSAAEKVKKMLEMLLF